MSLKFSDCCDCFSSCCCRYNSIKCWSGDVCLCLISVAGGLIGPCLVSNNFLCNKRSNSPKIVADRTDGLFAWGSLGVLSSARLLFGVCAWEEEKAKFELKDFDGGKGKRDGGRDGVEDMGSDEDNDEDEEEEEKVVVVVVVEEDDDDDE